MLLLSEEKLKLEAASRQKLEAELARAKQESDALRKSKSTEETSTNVVPQKLFVSPVF